MSYFSIITINLNNAAGLQKTIDSVLSQACIDYEYIIIDGGSTDESIDIIKKHAEKISYWISEKDAGIFDAMNKGISVAKGEYCLFLNSGDYLYQNDILEKVVDSKLSDAIIYGDIMNARDGIIVSKINSPPKLSSFFLLSGAVAHPAQFIKRELFVKFGPYSTEYKISSDYEYFIKIFFKNGLKINHIPIVISVFDLSGISNNPLISDIFYQERKLIHKKYFPKSLSILYSGFIIIWRSRLINNSIVSVPVKYIKNLILKVMGEVNTPYRF